MIIGNPYLFWQRVSYTAIHIINPFLQQIFFARRQFYQALLKLPGAFNLQLSH